MEINFLNNIIKNSLFEYPLFTVSKSNSEVGLRTFSLGLGKQLPSMLEFQNSRLKNMSHSDTFTVLKHKKLYELFLQLETTFSKDSIVYIFWANYHSNHEKLKSLESYMLVNKNSYPNNLTYVNKLNLEQQKVRAFYGDLNIVPIYVGKSEGKINGRIICHTDYTGGKYRALKLREHCSNANIYLSLVNFTNIKTEKSFWSKSLPFTLEYFLASKLRPVLGMHK